MDSEERDYYINLGIRYEALSNLQMEIFCFQADCHANNLSFENKLTQSMDLIEKCDLEINRVMAAIQPA